MARRGILSGVRADRRFKHVLQKPPRPQPTGQSREDISVPISPSGTLSDGVVYEDPDDPAVRLHLPRLRLRDDTTSYDIRVTNEAGRWSIRFGIEPFPAEELGDDARTPALLFTIPTASLEYHAPPMDKQIAASEIIPDAGGWTLGFDTDLAEKDEVLWALSEHGIKLVVPRSFSAAVPVVVAPKEPVGYLTYVDHRLLLEAAQGESAEPAVVVAEPVRPLGVEVRVRDDRTEDKGPSVRVRDHRGGPGGAQVTPPSRSAGRVQVTPPSRSAGRVQVTPPTRRGKVVVTPVVKEAFPIVMRAGVAKPIARKERLDMLDRFRDIAFDPGQLVVSRLDDQPSDEVRYRETPTVLPAEISLRLGPATHPEIFSGGVTDAPRFRTVRVIHPSGTAGRSHVYFQDEKRPNTFYYLPDKYCLDRTETLPLRPAVLFRVEQGQDENDARTVLTFRLAPHIDHDRLEAAVDDLRRYIPPPREEEPVAEVILEPVQAEAELNLGLPAGADLETQDLDLVNGFSAEISFPFDKFQDVFAALASAQELGAMLRGSVDVAVASDDGPTSGHALIPVDIRFGSANNDVLTAEDSVVAGGRIALTLRNSSESPVRIDALPLRMTRGDVEVPATAQGLELPLELAAGAETSFEVTPSEPLPGEGDLEVLVDMATVVPLPDPEAILALTLDQQIAQMSEREVSVVIPRARLAGGDDPLHSVFVEFAGSHEVVQVDAEAMEVRAAVPVPLVDVLLRRDSAPYRYRQTVLRDSGEHRDTEWRTSDAGILVVPVL